MASCAKVLLSECVTIGLQLRKHATRCSQVVVWLVWMGLMSAFQNDVRNSGKMNTFLGIFAGVNECSFCAKFISFAVGFGDSLAHGIEELWRFQNSCLSASRHDQISFCE